MDLQSQVKLGKRPFIFLNAWGDHEQLKGVVQRVWEERVEGNEMYSFITKHKKVKRVLKNWNWEVFGNIFEKLSELEEKVSNSESAMQTDPSEEKLWVVEGERNSKYFHGLVKERRAKQVIHKIKNNEGEWVEEQSQIADLAVEFFQKLYTAEPLNRDNSVFECLQVSVTEEENQKLIAEPTLEEIRATVYSMNPNSACGPDGFGGLTRAITSTSIVLIPKVTNPASFNEFRPISLSNFCSKVITKIMVQRLAEWIGGCIQLVLEKLGFCKKWIDLVNGSINNIWYSAIVNGEAKGFFHSSRGLRQGDHLSPSLFILASELLSRLINQKQAKITQPVQRPQVTHLAFADDMVVFTLGKNGGIKGVMEALEKYEGQSGQLINKNKSAFYMHRRVSQEAVEKMKEGEKSETVYWFGGESGYQMQGVAEGKKKHYWSSWKTLARPAAEGGVGFTGFKEMIDAAGAKLWWNLRKGESIWSQFMLAKYCNGIHPVVRGWNYRDSHIWRRMVDVRERVEPRIEWEIRRGNLNVWWDNWSGKGALAIWLNRRGKGGSREMLKDGNVNGAVDLRKFGIQDQTLAQNIRTREGPDMPIWQPTRANFNFKIAKALMREHGGENAGLWCKKIWAKGISWKMSFLA
ncbi:PREDICTED: uncharacterized protein LOC109190182 [Ipomoea nil]|uniref:uncharacterized protein LOC109190182 n=1 Tax=Ipomoea nil TaxID=35883 RepID=UPI000901D5A3|nr:PREDICTED: uncharacterized protein LOC109190182 [Ipomoea nil]